ncbi:MAG: hypothetical protein KKE86_07870 [Planctomycetes bacterium]|nr:hypothetical protein [Planctomycetota bacterium]MBU4399235.1 hypothetical protein [Planctomycetota bacterium]
MGNQDIDTKEFVALLTRYSRRIYSFIRALVPNQTDAEDLFQDVSATLWEKYGTFRKGRATFGRGRSKSPITKCSTSANGSRACRDCSPMRLSRSSPAIGCCWTTRWRPAPTPWPTVIKDFAWKTANCSTSATPKPRRSRPWRPRPAVRSTSSTRRCGGFTANCTAASTRRSTETIRNDVLAATIRGTGRPGLGVGQRSARRRRRIEFAAPARIGRGQPAGL